MLKVGQRYKSIYRGSRSYKSIIEIIKITEYRVSFKIIEKGKSIVYNGENISVPKKSFIGKYNYYKLLNNKIKKL